MKKLVYLPLDERPCNARFAPMLFNGKSIRVATPSVLGEKKTPASFAELEKFLVEECRDADGLVLSMDMLLYGGLIPSRLHYMTEEEAQARLALVRGLKKANPKLTIYAFQCIMRCPQYSSSDEEPDYYEHYGRELFLLGEAQHRQSLGLSCNDPEELRAKIPADVLNDFVSRRAFNLKRNLDTLSLVEDGVIDFLIFPQDDSAPYGYTAIDQKQVRTVIAEKKLWLRVYMYPGADELGLTLSTRMALHFAGLRPGVYINYAATTAPTVIPLYEDRSVGESIKYQLLAAGMRIVSSAPEADIILAVNAPASPMREAAAQPVTDREYTVERTLIAFALYVQDCLNEGRIVTIADIAYANGADQELVALLNEMGILDKLQGYAGWNTSSNTLGTSIAMGAHALLEGLTPEHRSFMALRLVEDAGYCGCVRGDVNENELPQLGLNWFDAGGMRGEVSEIVRDRLNTYVQEKLTSVARHIVIDDVWMPWKRIFEVGLDIHWEE
ncbi:MAG: DUF4127 family protein [Clostridia bacterium]|nr:DUF4127 family protein [Clostridia bacterium]